MSRHTAMHRLITEFEQEGYTTASHPTAAAVLAAGMDIVDAILWVGRRTAEQQTDEELKDRAKRAMRKHALLVSGLAGVLGMTNTGEGLSVEHRDQLVDLLEKQEGTPG